MAKTAIAKDQIKAFVARIERLLEEKAAITSDVKEVYLEAEGVGYDAKTIRRVVRERKLDKAAKQEADALFDLYWGALEGTPLAQAANQKAA